MTERKYWYKTYIQWCPVCGREDKWKERQYTEKPEDYNERVKMFYDTSCTCIYM